jgi:hypothetical protein
MEDIGEMQRLKSQVIMRRLRHACEGMPRYEPLIADIVRLAAG